MIGIYDEPKTMAIPGTTVMKERLLIYGKTLIERGHYLEMGTHDEIYIRKLVDEIIPDLGISHALVQLHLSLGDLLLQLHRAFGHQALADQLGDGLGVIYPGLASHPQHELASQQMDGYGAVVSFRLRGDLTAVGAFMNRLEVFTLALERLVP